MITSPNSDGVILLGCFDYRENIYQMAPDSNGAFVWSKMKQTLKYPRTSGPIIAYIDDDLTNCYYSAGSNCRTCTAIYFLAKILPVLSYFILYF